MAAEPPGPKFDLKVLKDGAEQTSSDASKEEIVSLLIKAGLSSEVASQHCRDFFDFFASGSSAKLVTAIEFYQEFVRMSCFRAVFQIRKMCRQMLDTSEVQKVLENHLGARGGKDQYASMMKYAEKNMKAGGSPQEKNKVDVKILEQWYWDKARSIIRSRKHFLEQKGYQVGDLVGDGSSSSNSDSKPEDRIQKRTKREATICLLGIDNAGKSTFQCALLGETDPSVMPTFGFDMANFDAKFPSSNPFSCEVYDLPGGEDFGRSDFWQNYYGDSHAFAFVVDSTDRTRTSEALSEFSHLIGHSATRGKPIAIIANKQDIKEPQPYSGSDLKAMLGVPEKIPADRHCKLFECVATKGCKESKGVEGGVARALKWLLETLDPIYEKIDNEIKEFKIKDRERADAEIKAQRKRTEEWKRKEREENGEVENEGGDGKGKGDSALDSRGKVAAIFKMFDVDKDGYLNFKEFQSLLSKTDGAEISEDMYRNEFCHELQVDPDKGVGVSALFVLLNQDEIALDKTYMELCCG